MKKNIFKFMGFCLSVTLFYMSSTLTTYACENDLVHLSSVIDARCTKVPDNEVPELERQIAMSAREAGMYEPNNSIATAFPYQNADKIKCDHDSSWPYGHYNCFYTPNTLESEDDIDFFSVKTGIDQRYAIVLKNVWLDQVRDIRVYYQESDGSWYYWYPTQKKERQSIFHITTTTNQYYIRITGSAAPGYTFTDTPNWFAMERDGTIDERAHVGDPNPYCSLQ